MTHLRTLAICAFGMALLGHNVEGQVLSRYRAFALESDLVSVSTLTGATSLEARTIHRRPALLQDLEWRLSSWVSGSTSTSTDPVEKIVFSFYDNQLFRIVVDYRSDRTEGMTDADMIEAISAVYGTRATRTPGAPRAASQVEMESGSAVARWADAEHIVVLYRTSSYRRAFRLVVTQPRLDELARKAAAQAVRLDEQEAPRLEIAREQQERDDARKASDKARITNKELFQP